MEIELAKEELLSRKEFEGVTVDTIEYKDGIQRGSLEVLITTSDNDFKVSLSPTTGLSVAQAWDQGTPIFMESPVPLHTNPIYNSQINMIEGWLGSFYQAIIRCGLRWHGAPSVEVDPKALEDIATKLASLINTQDSGMTEATAEEVAKLLAAYDTNATKLPLHGRIGLTPARDVKVSYEGDGVVKVSGCVDEKMFFFDKLLLSTQIYIDTRRKIIRIEDQVTNVSKEKSSPVSLLYHANFGLMGSGTEMICAYESAEARADPISQSEQNFRKFSRPMAGYKERCCGYDMLADNNGDVYVLLVSPNGKKGRYIRYNKKQLPQFFEWKMCGKDHYVVGLEPGIGEPLGRQTELAKNHLKVLGPTKYLDAGLETGVLNQQQTAEMKKKIQQIQKVKTLRG